MKKTLLFGAVALCSALSSSAFEVGEFVYAPQGRFKIDGANICTNGTCASNFDGWTAVSATEGNTVADLFTYDPDKGSFYSKSNVMTEGMYYKFNVDNPSGAYVVSFKIRQETFAYPGSTNVVYTTTDNVNTYGKYAGLNFVSLFGNSGGYTSAENFVSLGKGVNLTSDWQTVAFAIPGDGTARDWYLAFTGMNPAVEISDVQIQPATQYANIAQRDDAIDFVKEIVNAKDWEETDYLVGLKENIEAVESITEESSQAELDEVLGGLTEALESEDGFLANDMDDFIATCTNGTDWSKRTKSTGKLQKQTGIGDWKFYDNNGNVSDRGFNQDGSDLCGVKDISWWELGHYMYGTTPSEMSMRMTKDLAAGVYVYSMDCSGATRYTKDVDAGWTYNLGFTPLDNELYVKDAEGNVIASSIVNVPSDSYEKNYIVFNITKDGSYEIGSKTYPREDSYYGTLGTLGFGYFFKNPRIYCKLSGTHTAEELQYIADVKTQIAAAAANLEEAKTLLAKEETPWLKAEMNALIAENETYVQFYQTLDDETIFNGFVDPTVGKENQGYANMIDGEDEETGAPIPTYNEPDSIMDKVVRPIKRFCETYTKANAVFSDLTSAINDAKSVKAMPIYSTATGQSALADAIATAEATYKDKEENGSYDTAEDATNEDYNAMVEAKTVLEAAVADFKTTIPAESVNALVDIDFSNEPTLNEETSHYVIAGEKGSIDIDNFNVTETSGNTSFTVGYVVNEEDKCPGVLRVGNGNAVVTVDPEEYKGKIVRVSFDYYFGALINRNTGFYLKNDENETVAGLFFSPYSNTESVNTFAFDRSKFTAIGSSSQSNDVICDEANNKTSFELVLNYANKTMYGSTVNSKKGSQMTAEIAIPGNFTQFVVTSNYNIDARRSWFDNLKIETIAVDPTGVKGVSEATAETADDAIYNVAGQKVAAPVKGQIYVKKGAAFVK